MKKAVIQLGASQYIVSENDLLSVSIAQTEDKKLTLPALLIIDDKAITVGAPHVKDVSVELSVDNQEARAPKVTAIRYKAKKRVMKVRGHKQHLTELKVTKIA